MFIIEWKADHTTFLPPEREVPSSNQRVSSKSRFNLRFPREDLNAPRMRIVKRECPPEFSDFVSCLDKNSSKPELCIPIR